MAAATPRAAALAVSGQPKEFAPILLVPSPQKNIAGAERICFETVILPTSAHLTWQSSDRDRPPRAGGSGNTGKHVSQRRERSPQGRMLDTRSFIVFPLDTAHQHTPLPSTGCMFPSWSTPDAFTKALVVSSIMSPCPCCTRPQGLAGSHTTLASPDCCIPSHHARLTLPYGCRSQHHASRRRMFPKTRGAKLGTRRAGGEEARGFLRSALAGGA